MKGSMAYRKIMIRAKNLTKAKQFAKMYRKLSTFNYSPERVVSVKRNFKAGLAGGVPGWDVTLARRKTQRGFAY